jgi:hypothetical protein
MQRGEELDDGQGTHVVARHTIKECIAATATSLRRIGSP